MTIQPIDIQINDQVSDTIAPKIDTIAVSADKASISVQKLQDALKKIDSQPFTQLAKAYTQLTASMQDQANAYLANENALNRAIVAENNATVSSLKLQAAKEKLTRATARQQSAEDKLAASYAKENARTQAAAAQAAFNSLLGVNQPVTNSARASASAMSELMRQAEATAAAEAIAKGESKGLADALGNLTLSTARSRTELVILGRNLLNGNFTLATRSLIVLGEQTNAIGVVSSVLSSIFSLEAIALTAVSVAAAVYTAALIAGNTASAALARSLQSVGGFAGVTSEQFLKMADTVAASTNSSISNARSVQSALVSSGKFQGDQISQNAASILNLSKQTGQSAEEITKAFLKMADGPGKFAEEFEKQYHTIGTSQVEYIKNLEDQGQKEKAISEASKIIYQEYGTSHVQNLGLLQRAWESVGNAISNAWTNLKDFGRTDLEAQITRQQAVVQQFTAFTSPDKLSPNDRAGYDAAVSLLNKLQDQAKTQEHLTVLAKETTAAQLAGTSAVDALRSHFLPLVNDALSATNQVKAFKKALDDANKAASTNPNDPARQLVTQAQQQSAAIIAKINEKHNKEGTSRTLEIQKFNAELKKQIDLYGLLNEQREEQNKIDTINLQLQGRKHAPLSPAESANTRKLIEQAAHSQAVNSAADSLFGATDTAAVRNFNLQIEAAGVLLKKGSLNQDDYTRAILRSTETLLNSIDPFRQVNQQLDQSLTLFGLVGNARVIETQMLQKEQQLQAAGYSLNDPRIKVELDQYKQKISLLQTLSGVQSALDKIYGENQGAQQNINEQLAAQVISLREGTTSAEQYVNAINQLAIAQANLNIQMGKGTSNDVAISSIGKILQSYKGILPGLTTTFGDFFSSIDEGVANSFGKWIVEGGSLKSLLVGVAQQGVEALIGSLIKLGVQYLLNATLGESAAATTTAANVALAASTATAWAPAAAAVSLATFGSNAVPASAGITATYGLTETLSALGIGFDQGGYTGDIGRSSIAGVVHGQEYVVNAAATARHRTTLEAMNSGSSVGGSTHITFAPTYQIDGTADKAQATKDMKSIAKRSQAELVDQLTRKKLLVGT